MQWRREGIEIDEGDSLAPLSGIRVWIAL
jgi:hypothetical protein